VVKRLCKTMMGQKHRVEWRFTIGSMDSGLLAYWEPGASFASERVEALDYALAACYRASVSMEPYLGSVDDTRSAACLFADMGAETVWIGLMNNARQRVRRENERDGAMLQQVLRNQTDAQVRRLDKALAGQPWVRWKDSIRRVIDKG
jgi:DNA repair photolyase